MYEGLRRRHPPQRDGELDVAGGALRAARGLLDRAPRELPVAGLAPAGSAAVLRVERPRRRREGELDVADELVLGADVLVKDLGPGRIVASETEAPNTLANPV